MFLSQRRVHHSKSFAFFGGFFYSIRPGGSINCEYMLGALRVKIWGSIRSI